MDLIMEKVYNCIEAINLRLLNATKSYTSWRDEKKITVFWVAVVSILLVVVCTLIGVAATPKAASIDVTSTTEKESTRPTTTVDYWIESRIWTSSVTVSSTRFMLLVFL